MMSCAPVACQYAKLTWKAGKTPINMVFAVQESIKRWISLCMHNTLLPCISCPLKSSAPDHDEVKAFAFRLVTQRQYPSRPSDDGNFNLPMTLNTEEYTFHEIPLWQNLPLLAHMAGSEGSCLSKQASQGQLSVARSLPGWKRVRDAVTAAAMHMIQGRTRMRMMSERMTKARRAHQPMTQNARYYNRVPFQLASCL